MSGAADFFGEALSSGLVTSVSCSGTETGILECDHDTSSQGLHCDTAGVVCQGTILGL